MTRSATAADGLVGELGGRDPQHPQHELDVEVGQHAGVEEQRAAPVEVQPEPGDLATAREQVVLAAELGPHADPAQALDHALRRARGSARAAAVAGAGSTRATPSWSRPMTIAPPPVGRRLTSVPVAAHAVEVDLGVQGLVAADERGMVRVGVQPQGRPRWAGSRGRPRPSAPRRGRGQRRRRRRRRRGNARWSRQLTRTSA